MIDRADAEAAIFRTAFAAFAYYPAKPFQEVGYTVDEDLDWCLEPLGELTDDELGSVRGWMREVVTDPNADRQAFMRALRGLADI